jgi:rhodanese-related sulfurtransferase
MIERASLFLETLGEKFRMISREQLLKKVKESEHEKPLIIDFRAKLAFQKSRIKNSINMDIKELSKSINMFDKNTEVIAVCNGSIQSAYAIYYLYLNGFENVFNLSGGFSGCLNNNFQLIETSEN